MFRDEFKSTDGIPHTYEIKVFEEVVFRYESPITRMVHVKKFENFMMLEAHVEVLNKLKQCGLITDSFRSEWNKLAEDDCRQLISIFTTLPKELLIVNNFSKLLQNSTLSWRILDAVDTLHSNQILDNNTLKAILKFPFRALETRVILEWLNQAKILNVDNINKLCQQNFIKISAIYSVLSQLSKAGIVSEMHKQQSQSNYLKVLQYPQYIEQINEDLKTKKITQAVFDEVIQQYREKMEWSFLNGLHSRVGEMSIFHQPFQSRPNSNLRKNSIADPKVITEIFKFV